MFLTLSYCSKKHICKFQRHLLIPYLTFSLLISFHKILLDPSPYNGFWCNLQKQRTCDCSFLGGRLYPPACGSRQNVALAGHAVLWRPLVAAGLSCKATYTWIGDSGEVALVRSTSRAVQSASSALRSLVSQQKDFWGGRTITPVIITQHTESDSV